MTELERHAKIFVNKARSALRAQQLELMVDRPPSEGVIHRIEELGAAIDVLGEAAAHIDPHIEVPWEFQTPLPFS